MENKIWKSGDRLIHPSTCACSTRYHLCPRDAPSLCLNHEVQSLRESHEYLLARQTRLQCSSALFSLSIARCAKCNFHYWAQRRPQWRCCNVSQWNEKSIKRLSLPMWTAWSRKVTACRNAYVFSMDQLRSLSRRRKDAVSAKWAWTTLNFLKI